MNQTINQIDYEPKEFEEKTVEKAIRAACQFYGCSEEDLDIEIITRGSTGLFGLGGKKAKIRVYPKEGISVQEPLVEEEGEQGFKGPSDQGPLEVEEEKAREVEVQEEVSEPVEKRGGQALQKGEELSQDEIQQHLAKAAEIANQILEKSGLSGSAEVVDKAQRPFINIDGEDLSLIIGKDGQTLNALEYIVNLCLRHAYPQVSYRVMLEAKGYRDRRRKSLISLAEKLAIKARRTGRSVSLQPMPARERRIIHIALKDFKGVRTHSSGEGSHRKVVITPTRKKRYHRRSRH